MSHIKKGDFTNEINSDPFWHHILKGIAKKQLGHFLLIMFDLPCNRESFLRSHETIMLQVLIL